MRATFAALAALVLAACAAASGDRMTYQQELDELHRVCQSRGGMLVPTRRMGDGRPAIDYVCEIRGGSGRMDIDD